MRRLLVINPSSHISVAPSLFLCVMIALLAGTLGSCVVSETDRKALENGFSDYSARRFDSAQAAADQFIQKNPAAPNIDEAFYLRGIARMSKASPSEKTAAAKDLHTAIEKTKRNDLKAKASRALGDIAFDAQQWQQAIDRYEQSVSLAPAPSDAWFHYRYGAALQNLGQWDKSRPAFQRVISLNSEALLTKLSISRLNAGSFSLQFGAFGEQPRAAELVRQLNTPGGSTPPIPATIATELRDGKLLYLVRTGSYSTLQEAEAARSRLLPKYPQVTVFP